MYTQSESLTFFCCPRSATMPITSHRSVCLHKISCRCRLQSGWISRFQVAAPFGQNLLYVHASFFIIMCVLLPNRTILTVRTYAQSHFLVDDENGLGNNVYLQFCEEYIACNSNNHIGYTLCAFHLQGH